MAAHTHEGTSDDEVSPTAPPHPHAWGEPRKPSVKSSSAKHRARRGLFGAGGDSASSDDEEADFISMRHRIKQRSAEFRALNGGEDVYAAQPTEEQQHLARLTARLNIAISHADTVFRPAPEPVVATTCPPPAWDSLSADALCLLGRALDLPGALALGATCRSVQSAVMGDVAMWQTHADALGVRCGIRASPRARLTAMKDAWLLRAGDCIEVRDPYGLWSAARIVVACIHLLPERLTRLDPETYTYSNDAESAPEFHIQPHTDNPRLAPTAGLHSPIGGSGDKHMLVHFEGYSSTLNPALTLPHCPW